MKQRVLQFVVQLGKQDTQIKTFTSESLCKIGNPFSHFYDITVSLSMSFWGIFFDAQKCQHYEKAYCFVIFSKRV